MIRDRYLEDALRQLRKYKELAERAIAQVSGKSTGLEVSKEGDLHPAAAGDRL